MKKAISLTFFLILALFVLSAASYADGTGIFIGGVEVPSAGGEVVNPAIKSGSVSYDPVSDTLTLDNAVISTVTDVIERTTTDDLKIAVKGSCEVVIEKIAYGGVMEYAAVSNFSNDGGGVKISGDGTLTIRSEDPTSPCLGSKHDVCVDGCTLIAEAENADGIYCWSSSSLTFSNANVTVKVKGDNIGIRAGNIEITGSTLDVTGGYNYPILAINTISIIDSEVSVSGDNHEGIYSSDGAAITGSRVTVVTGSNGAYYPSINFSSGKPFVIGGGSDVTIISQYRAIAYAPDLSGFTDAAVDYGDSEAEALCNVAKGAGLEADYYMSKYVRIHPENKPEPAPAPEETGARGSKGSEGVPIVIGRNPYSGAGIWLAGAGQHAAGPAGIGIFRADVPFSKFRGVAVDGKTLSDGDYRAYEGSTIVELEGSFLKTLGDGAHTISITFTDGTAETNFYIGSEENPDTGAPVPVLLTLGAVILSAAAVRKH